MATPEPFAVGTYFSAVMPEVWTKSMPDSVATSVKRRGPGWLSPDASIVARPRPFRSEGESGPSVGEDRPAEDAVPTRNGIAGMVPPADESPSGLAAGRPAS